MPRRKIAYLMILVAALTGCNGSYNSGDRVLVEKFAYDAGIGGPRRFDVVVFKYPREPVSNGVPKNYIKRLLGLPGELLAIFFGQLFVLLPEPGAPPLFDDSDVPLIDRWKTEFMHSNDPRSENLFNMAGKFTIVRKPPEVMLAMRRIVNDNDFQPSDLTTKRWEPALTSSWKADENKGFFIAGGNKSVDWLRYKHLTRSGGLDDGRFDGRIDPDKVPPEWQLKPKLITDFMDYNFPQKDIAALGQNPTPGLNWVGDLMIECRLTVSKAEGEVWLELSRGIHRFQARFELDSGQCTLFKLSDDGKKIEQLGQTATRVKGPGAYDLRLANFDARLTLWVDHDLPFGDGVDYPPPDIRNAGEEKLSDAALAARRGPTKNDLEPASIGSRSADVKIQHLRMWRDTYYTLYPSPEEGHDYRLDDGSGQKIDMLLLWRDEKQWGPFRKLGHKIMFVQPGHYLCLGDNSPMSADSRDWGLVPERLMLGRALMVYWPANRAGAIK